LGAAEVTNRCESNSPVTFWAVRGDNTADIVADLFRSWVAKALGCKLAKAAWHVVARPCDQDPERMFPEQAASTQQRR
jgi:hypothetical protein